MIKKYLRKPHYSWLVLAALCGLAFANRACGVNILTVFFLPMAEEFDWNRTQISGAASIGALIGAGASILMGRLSDYMGPRIILGIGALIVTFSMIALSQMTMIIVFYIFYGAARVSDQGLIQTVSPSTLTKWFSGNSGRAVSIYFGFMALGGVLLPFLTHLAIMDFGWRSGWLLLASVMFFIGFVPTVLLVGSPGKGEDNTGNTKSESENVPTEFSLSQTLNSKDYWFIAIAVFVTGILTAGIGLHIVPFLVGQGLSPEIAVSTVSIRFLSSSIGGFVAGFLIDRYGPRPTVIGALAIRIISIGLLIFADTFFEAIFTGALDGFSDGAQSTAVVLLLVSYFGKSNVGGIYGVTRAFKVAGFSAGPIIAAIWFDLSGSYSAVLWAFFLLAILSVILISSTRRIKV